VVLAEMILLFGYAIPGWTQRVGAFPSESGARRRARRLRNSLRGTCTIPAPTESSAAARSN